MHRRHEHKHEHDQVHKQDCVHHCRICAMGAHYYGVAPIMPLGDPSGVPIMPLGPFRGFHDTPAAQTQTPLVYISSLPDRSFERVLANYVLLIGRASAPKQLKS